MEEQIKSMDNQLFYLNVGTGACILGAVAGGAIAGAGGGMLTGAGFLKGGLITAGGAALAGSGLVAMVYTIKATQKIAKQKNKLVVEKVKLKNEIKATKSIQSGIDAAATGAKMGSEAAQAMIAFWSNMAQDLGNVGTGAVETGAVRKVFLTLANGDIRKVQDQTETIKAQMAGVRQISSPNAMVFDTVEDEMQKTACWILAAPPVRWRFHWPRR